MNMLTEEQKQSLADRFIRLPRNKQIEISEFLQNSPVAFDIWEYVPARISDDVDQFMETAGQELTLGLYEAEDNPNAGDFIVPEGVPYLGGEEISPAAALGGIAGTVAPALAGYGIGTAIARRVIPSAARAAQKVAQVAARTPNPNAGTGLAVFSEGLKEQGARQLAAMNARVPLSIPQRLIGVAIGETLPGGMQGYIKSDGDIDKAISTAGEWMMMGLIFEGAFIGIVKAFKKVREGKKLNKKDQASLSSYDGIFSDVGKRAAKFGNVAGAKIGSVMDNIMGDRISDLMKEVVGGTKTRAQWNATIHSMVEETMNRGSTWTEEGKAFFLQQLNDFSDGLFYEIRSGNMSPKELKRRVGVFSRRIDDSWDDYNEPGVNANAYDEGQGTPPGQTKTRPGKPDSGPTPDEVIYGPEYHPRQRGPTVGTEATRARGPYPVGEGKYQDPLDYRGMPVDDEVIPHIDEAWNRIVQRRAGDQSRRTAAGAAGTPPHLRKTGYGFEGDSAGAASVDDPVFFDPKTGKRRDPTSEGEPGVYQPDKESDISDWVDIADDYVFVNGDAGNFMLKGDKTPIHGVIEEAGAQKGFYTIRGADGQAHSGINISRIERFSPDRKGKYEPYIPITDFQLEELRGLYIKYKDIYGEPPRGFPEARAGVGSQSHKKFLQMSQVDAKRWTHRLKVKIRQGKNRHSARNDQGLGAGSFEEGRKVFAESEVTSDIYAQDTFLPRWLVKLMPTYAKYGLSANKPIAIEVRRMLHQMEIWGRDTNAYLDRYRAALEPLALSKQEQFAGWLPGAPTSNAKMRKHKLEGQKIKIAQALDGDPTDILRANPELRQPYEDIRKILDDLADEMGLERGDRIANYFPHIFSDAVGGRMARDIAMELGARGRFMTDGVAGVGLKEGGDFPTERLFVNLLERTGAEGFNLDLDAALYAYIKGSVKKPGMDEFLRRSHNLMDDLPLTNASGGEHVTRKLYNDYVRYVTGQPGSGRIMAAQFWQNNDIFNHWVDKLLVYLGDADPQMKDWLAKSRMGSIDPSTGQRQPYSVEAELNARQYFRRLVDDANMYTSEGELKGTPGSKQKKAALAIKVEEIRLALKDPNAKPLIISRLYSLMVVNKLGLNFSHALINTTQGLTNTLPMVGARNFTLGLRDYVSIQSSKFKNRELPSGKTVEEVLNDLGVLSDTIEAQEFMPSNFGWRKDVMDGVVMAPARITEKFNRGVAGLAAYRKFIGQGMTHEVAIEHARDLVIKTQFPFNKAGVSPIFQTPMARFLLMFKSYPLHQINFSAEILMRAVKEPTAENMTALTTHVMSYMAMWGMGASALSQTNFQWRAQHPIGDLTRLGSFDEALNTLAGPPAGVIIDILHGQVMAGARDLAIPTFVERGISATQAPTPGQAFLEGVGL